MATSRHGGPLWMAAHGKYHDGRRIVYAAVPPWEQLLATDADSVPERRLGEILASVLASRTQELADRMAMVQPHARWCAADQSFQWESDFAVFVNDRVLLLECDGLAYHGDRETFIRDRRKDRDAAYWGWETMRFAASEITGKPQSVQAEVLGALDRLLATVGPFATEQA